MARGNFLSRMLGSRDDGPAKLPAMQEAGVSGTPRYGGYLREPESSARMIGANRYRFAADILTNTSIVAAGVRYFLNLVSKPKWKVTPADETDAAQEVADFVEECLFGMATSWSRIIRRSGMFRYHGFGIGEWTAIKRDDGRIGLKDIESRPQHTIYRWGSDDQGAITGVWQRNPQNGQEIWLPRSKIVYLVDDMMTDSPEGLGWFRALAEPANRLKRYLEIETIAYERNLAGVPVGRIPYAEIESAVKGGALTREEADKVIDGMEQFVDLQAKNRATSLILDSAPYESTTADGTTVSPVLKWGIELLKGDMTGVDHLGLSIHREIHQLARIIGIETLLLGADGKGSMALSKVQSENLSLVINSTVQDMAEAFDRDAIGPIVDLNGIPDKLRPTLGAEDVAFKDVLDMSQFLANMAMAGAVMQPDDPAINDMRALAGLPDQSEPTPAMMNPSALGVPGSRGTQPADPNKPAPDPNANKDESARGGNQATKRAPRRRRR